MLSSSVWRGSSHWWFSTGLILGGVTAGLLAATLGSLVLRPILTYPMEVAAVVATLALISAREFGLLTFPLPQNGRQVPESVVLDGGAYGALHFGYEMGVAVRTFMTSGLPHALGAAVALLAGWPAALLAGAAFGLGRAWMTLARHWHDDPQAWDASLDSAEKRIKQALTVAVLIAASSVIS